MQGKAERQDAKKDREEAKKGAEKAVKAKAEDDACEIPQPDADMAARMAKPSHGRTRVGPGCRDSPHLGSPPDPLRCGFDCRREG